MLIVNNQHTATIEQTAVRLVDCEECDTEYVYQLSRSGEGMANSPYFLDESGAKRRAERKAKEQLSKKMRTACEAIPCPRCGHYQAHMMSRARSDATLKWVLLTGLAAAFMIGGFILALSTKATMLGVGLGIFFLAVMVTMAVVGFVVNNSYDPNKKPEDERLKIAEDNATVRKVFEQAFAELAVEEFEKFCKKLAKKKNRKFKMVVWADRGQIRNADPIKVKLPVGDKVTVKLRSDSRDGDEFVFPYDVDEFEIEIVCTLNVYTKTKLQDR